MPASVPVTTLHLLATAFSLLTPFSNNVHLLLLYLIIIPFGMMHWCSDADMCAATMMEMFFRGVSKSSCFTNKILKPMYCVNDRSDAPLVYVLGFGLWFMVLYKLLTHPEMKHAISNMKNKGSKEEE